MLTGNNVKSNKHRLSVIVQQVQGALNRRDKADQLRNLVENFSMILKD
jgi:hypothetical protein